MEDERRWAGSVSTIIRELLLATPGDHDIARGVSLLNELENIIVLEFDRETIDQVSIP